jgi:hypothetical protein
MKEDILKQLYETFQLREREGQGGMKFKYVPNEDVINRMNKIFMGDWSTEVRDKDIVDDQVVLEVAVSITDLDSGKVHTHAGFGSQQIMRYNKGPNAGKIIDIGNAYKGALSKAIVNACTRWGVGLFKERNAYELDNITPVEDGPNSPSTGAPVAVPPAPPEAPVTPAPTGETAAFPTPPTAKPANSVPNSVPTPPAEPETNTTKFPPVPPAPGQTVSAGVSVTQAPAKEMPKVPGPMEQPSVPKAAPEMPATPSLPFTPQQNGNDKISDVQRVALNGILSMRDIKYEVLAKEAFEARGIDKAIPPKEQLSYEDAVIVIKYGNDKYRKGNV